MRESKKAARKITSNNNDGTEDNCTIFSPTCSERCLFVLSLNAAMITDGVTKCSNRASEKKHAAGRNLVKLKYLHESRKAGADSVHLIIAFRRRSKQRKAKRNACSALSTFYDVLAMQ